MSIEKTVFLFFNQLTGKEFAFDFTVYFLASILPYLFLLPFFYLFLRDRKKYSWFVGEVLFAGFFARYGLVEVFRHFFPRIRPFQLIEEVNLLLPYKESLSFPSGHTAFLFGISTVVYFYNKKIGIVLYFLAILMGVSRIFSGMHWPLDILAGALVGVASGLFVSEIAAFLKRKLTKG